MPDIYLPLVQLGGDEPMAVMAGLARTTRRPVP